MTIQQYDKISAECGELLETGRYFEAFRRLGESIDRESSLRIYGTELRRLEQTYGYVVKFALEGTKDPTREEMLRTIKLDLLTLMDRIRRSILTSTTSSLYYSIVRTRAHQQRESRIPELTERYRRQASDYSLTLFTDPDGKNDSSQKLKKQMEKTESELFTEIWTAFPLTTDESEILRGLMTDTVVGEGVKTVCLGALFLASYTFFDIRALTLLLEAYEKSERKVGLRALVMFLIVATTTSNRERLEPLRHRLAALADSEQWRTDIELIYNQFLNTRDTDRIVKMVNDEIIPSVKNMSSDFMGRFGDIDPKDPEALMNTDEFADMMENSDFARKMRKMSEIQENGGDIMMATFGHLKGFAFFRDIAAWFTPFDTMRTEVVEASGGNTSLAEVLSTATSLCDNDRYSLALSLKQLPSMQRDMIATQLEAQSRQMAELQAASNLTGTQADRETVSNFTRSLFRFFKLYERHNEFVNPFATSLNVLAIDMISEGVPASELLDKAAKFYYSHGYYKDALPLLRQQEPEVSGENAAMVYFCIGDCLYRMGETADALTYFERSEIFDSKNRDTIMRLAMLYRSVGNHRKAVSYLKRALATADEHRHRRLKLLLAEELVEIGDYAEAATIIYELDFAQAVGDTMRRRLAYCQLMLGELNKVEDTLLKIQNMNGHDFVMRSALDILEGHYENAASMLSLASTAGGLLPTAAEEALRHYNRIFRKSELDPTLLAIICDEAARRTAAK